MLSITIQTSEEISTGLNRIAKAMGKPRNEVIEAALKKYISDQTNQIAGIKQAQKTLANSSGKDFETVIEELRDKIINKK